MSLKRPKANEAKTRYFAGETHKVVVWVFSVLAQVDRSRVDAEGRE